MKTEILKEFVNKLIKLKLDEKIPISDNHIQIVFANENDIAKNFTDNVVEKAKECGIIICSAKSGITGLRPDYVVVDDIEENLISRPHWLINQKEKIKSNTYKMIAEQLSFYSTFENKPKDWYRKFEKNNFRGKKYGKKSFR